MPTGFYGAACLAAWLLGVDHQPAGPVGPTVRWQHRSIALHALPLPSAPRHRRPTRAPKSGKVRASHFVWVTLAVAGPLWALRSQKGPDDSQSQRISHRTGKSKTQRDLRPLYAANDSESTTRRPKRKPTPSLSRDYERSLVPPGCECVAGVDEAGRGPLAGPVVAAACVLPEDFHIPGIRDSKVITTEHGRESIYEALTKHPEVRWAVGVVHSDVIDDINILQATLAAMDIALQALPVAPDFVLIDGKQAPPSFRGSDRFATVIKGDATCLSIAAASIIAKVTRDQLMGEYHDQWPQYNFAKHKGYPTAAHRGAIQEHGPCPIHRRTFRPLRDWYPSQPNS